MVCNRCKMTVKYELKKIGFNRVDVELGEVTMVENMTTEQLLVFNNALLKSGLEVMDDKKSILIEKIKAVIIEMVNYCENPLTVNLSAHLSQKLNQDYSYLSNLFSELEGITLEKYYIKHKIEKVKELLVYNELTLTEIANRMNYNSVAHLSTQFKKITGLPPAHFKQLKDIRLSILESKAILRNSSQ